jgi:hypothetical protein
MRTFVLGEFSTIDAVLKAAATLRDARVGTLDAYSPYPLHGMEEALGLPRSRVPLMALVCGVSGACGGYLLQWWCNAYDYPLNVGNRLTGLTAGWPAMIPITFESGILATALSLFFGTIVFFFKLPRPYHPVFESEAFRSASLDAFWISIEREDDDAAATAPLLQQLRALGARRVETVRGPTE